MGFLAEGGVSNSRAFPWRRGRGHAQKNAIKLQRGKKADSSQPTRQGGKPTKRSIAANVPLCAARQGKKEVNAGGEEKRCPEEGSGAKSMY